MALSLLEKWREFDLRHRPGEPSTAVAERDATLPFEAFAGLFGFGGLDYPFIRTTSQSTPEEKVDANFSGYVEAAYKRNGIIFACVAAKLRIFTEARFNYQRLRDGRPTDMFSMPALDILERPWPNATTGDLLGRMLLDAEFAGNAFCRMRGQARGRPRQIRRMRPDWVTIITGSEDTDADPGDTDLLGYVYEPGGPGSGKDAIVLMPSEVAHFSPLADPMAEHRGMSWLTPILREVMGDGAATNHKLQFFENAATPNLAVTLGDVDLSPEAFEQWVDKMEGQHAGLANAYRTLYMASGADVKVVGADLKQVDFKAVQGAGETRIASAAGVPAVIVGISEGLQGSSLNAGNYQAAKRQFADGTLRHYWREAAGALDTIVGSPPDARLWYDARDIPFLQEDRKDAAQIMTEKTQQIRTLTDAGYDPDSVIESVNSEDLTRLKGAHAGLFSVQLQPPGANGSNGNGNTPTPQETPA
jgi:phage portal protein BeeE